MQQRTLVLGCALTLFLVVEIVALVRPRTYVATASFTPQAQKLPANVAGVAAQFGISLQSADPGASPDFYTGLLESRRILEKVIEAQYSFPTDTGKVTGNMVDILRIKPGPPAKRREKALRKMRRIVSTSIARQEGVIDLSVETRSPELSAQLAARLLDLLNRFNLETRQSQAAAERRFTERRLAEARGELLASEGVLQSFLERNRELSSSPLLTFQRERLERDVTVRQNVVNSLAQAFEQARIDEVRDIPVITIVEEPEPPALPAPRRLLLRGVLALAAGLVLGSLLAFFRAFLQDSRTEAGEEFVQFRALRQAMAQDLRRPWRLISRLASGRTAR